MHIYHHVVFPLHLVYFLDHHRHHNSFYFDLILFSSLIFIIFLVFSSSSSFIIDNIFPRSVCWPVVCDDRHHLEDHGELGGRAGRLQDHQVTSFLFVFCSLIFDSILFIKNACYLYKLHQMPFQCQGNGILIRLGIIK